MQCNETGADRIEDQKSKNCFWYFDSIEYFVYVSVSVIVLLLLHVFANKDFDKGHVDMSWNIQPS